MNEMEKVGETPVAKQEVAQQAKPVIIGREKKLQIDEIIFIFGMLVVPVVQENSNETHKRRENTKINFFICTFQKSPYHKGCVGAQFFIQRYRISRYLAQGTSDRRGT